MKLFNRLLKFTHCCHLICALKHRMIDYGNYNGDDDDDDDDDDD